MRVAVIGGGPAGLTTLKFLVTAHKYFPIPPIEARLFEAEKDVGGTFVYRVYEDAELVSSKYLTAFSDFRLPKDAPNFVTPQVYVQYLKDYCNKYDLWRYIECATKVVHVRPMMGNVGHVVGTMGPENTPGLWKCDAIAVCTGLHVHPSIPDIKGIERVPLVLHSSQLKERAQFGNSSEVVVLGAGETGMDIAHLAVTAPTKSVTLCHRDGFFCAPKIIPVPIPYRDQGKPLAKSQNKPVDTSVASLFDTAYVHPTLQQSQLLWWYYDRAIKSLHWLVSGTEEGPDQWVGQMSQSRRYLDSIILCKSDRALPYLSDGHRSESQGNRLRSKMLNVPIKDTKGRKIEVAYWPEEIDEEGYLRFKDNALVGGKLVKPDVMVFATGYNHRFPFLAKYYTGLKRTNVRGIYNSQDVTVGYIGFIRPAIGAMPPLAELQAQLWVYRLLQKKYPDLVPDTRDPNALESYELDYKMHARGAYNFWDSKRAVDHESYAYQLALDMGAAPTLSLMMKQGWKIFFTWAMGSNFNTKFRMVGPWQWREGAKDIMRNELYNIVCQSGGYVYMFWYTIVPFIIFGILSMLLYAMDAVTSVFQGPRVKTHKRVGAQKRKTARAME